MKPKPSHAADYSATSTDLVRSACLYIATKLGDLRDDLVIVGGLVPSLIIPQTEFDAPNRIHVGTMDVDLGLAIGILNEERYHELCQRLRSAGFEPDKNENGRDVNQRWRITSDAREVTVDFLIPSASEDDRGGALRNFEKGFAAIITPGLELAFEDRRLVTLTGKTVHDETAHRDLWVCEAGAFTVLKALAFQGRGENKDAYDLIYTLQNYGSGVPDVFRQLRPLLSNPSALKAIEILKRDFVEIDSVGPRRVAEFLGNIDDETIRADAAAAVRSLLGLCQKTG